MYEMEKTVYFSDMQDVREFVNAADNCDFDIDVYYKRAVIDAKSILGMLAIGLKQRVIVRYGGKNEQFENVIQKYATA